MNLNNLKSGWQQFKLESSFDKLGPEGILQILESEVKYDYFNGKSLTITGIVFVFLTICCQGG